MKKFATVAALVLLTACGTDDAAEKPETKDGKRVLKVLAASSLTEAFTELERAFESTHEDVDVQLSFDSSALLVEQLTQGLDADVLATADEKSMAKAAAADLLPSGSVPFATNTLVIVTPPGNPAGIDSLNDLADAKYAVCVPTAPCGDATKRLFALNEVALDAVTEEENVKGVLTKVTAGEVDAGLVYVSDARAAGAEVTTIVPAHAAEVVNVDPIAVLDPTNSDANLWVNLVRSDEARWIFEAAGFGPAPK